MISQGLIPRLEADLSRKGVFLEAAIADGGDGQFFRRRRICGRLHGVCEDKGGAWIVLDKSLGGFWAADKGGRGEHVGERRIARDGGDAARAIVHRDGPARPRVHDVGDAFPLDDAESLIVSAGGDALAVQNHGASKL